MRIDIFQRSSIVNICTAMKYFLFARTHTLKLSLRDFCYNYITLLFHFILAVGLNFYISALWATLGKRIQGNQVMRSSYTKCSRCASYLWIRKCFFQESRIFAKRSLFCKISVSFNISDYYLNIFEEYSKRLAL